MKYKLIMDNGKPSEEVFNSKKDLFNEIDKLSFVDSENCPYFDLFIEDKNGEDITDEIFKEFEDFLRKYKEVHSEDYNDDEFLELIKDKDWYVKTIMVDEEVYF